MKKFCYEKFAIQILKIINTQNITLIKASDLKGNI